MKLLVSLATLSILSQNLHKAILRVKKRNIYFASISTILIMYATLPGRETSVADLAAHFAYSAVSSILRWWKIIVTYQVLLFVALVLYIYAMGGQFDTFPKDSAAHHSHGRSENTLLDKRAWGGFLERPMNEKCYKQERTAMLLNLFLGTLGVDQFYAHHWPLAVFKLFTLGFFGLWPMIDQILWTVGGVYGTPGCPGGAGPGQEWQY